MPRFDRGVVNTKLEKGDIVLMGNPTQYGEILAENILVEDILKADLETLISGSNLVRGKFYRITNAVSSTLSLLVQGLTANTICDYAYNTANGDLVTYNISTDLAGVPFSSVYVPYTGATADVNLGEYQIKVGQLELDQTPTGTFGVGKIRWNDTDGTPEVMLKGANVTLQIGQEQLARVVNKTNTNLTEAGYQVVRISGAQGQRLKVGLAQANSTSTCKDTLGLVTENINNNAEGFITTSGLVRSINTTGSLQGETWADGDRIYLSPSVAGGITNVEPSAPNIVIVLGYVVYAHANQGSIYVSVEGAKALHELFDVSIPTPTNNNVLVYESSTGLWKDKSISTILGFTPIANNATVGGELSGTLPNPSLVTSAVTGKALTGLSVSGSAVVSTDSILTGIGKLQNQINAVVGSVNFQGVWNASTNTPNLTSSVGTKGYYYIVTVAGSTNLNGITDWKLGDWAIYDGSAWQKVDNTDAVVSVNGYTGIVTLAKADIGLGNVENIALSTWAGSANITTLGTIGTGVWNGTAIGDTYISSASTWNAKIGGSGTTGRLAKFTSSGAVGNSIITESGGSIGIDDLTNGRLLFGVDNATYNDIYSTTTGFGAYKPLRISATSYLLRSGTTDIFNLSPTELITFGAPDTGEAHIFGGSARVNGNMDIRSSNTFFGSQQGYVYILEDQINSYYSTNAEATLNINYFGYNQGATQFRNFRVFDGKTNPLFYIQGSTGNVGIGITSPAYKLSINGNAGIEASEEYFYFHSDYAVGSNARGKIRAVGAGGGSGFGGDLRFSSRASNNAWNEDVLVINSSGNVGIGTTSPLAPLHIKGNGTNSYNSTFITTNSYTDGVSGSILRFGHISTSGNQVAIIDNLFAGGTLVGGLSLNPTGGNVLIGTTTDDGVNKLQVSGSALATGEIKSFGIRSYAGNALSLHRPDNGAASTILTNASNELILSSAIGGTMTLGTGATFSSSVQATQFLSGVSSSSYQIQALAASGANRDIFAAQVNGVSNGVTIKWNNSTSKVLVNFTDLPTSSAGLSAGDIWNDGGTLKIV